MPIPSGAKVFNTVRASLDEVYLKNLPSATKDNINLIGETMLNDAYKPMLNQFVTNLINMIGLTIVRNKSFSNKLSMFKKGSVPLGTDIQDIYTNPATAKNYEFSNTAMAKLLTINDPDTHVAYYRRNRQDIYEKTISREGLKGAFASWDKFNDFIASVTTSLYSGNYISEFEYTKDLVDAAYSNNLVITEVINDIIDKDTAEEFVTKARALYSKMTLPSTKYNAYSKFENAKGEIKTWTEPERLVLIIKADSMAQVDVKSLAQAFNLEKGNFIGRVIEVDEFSNPDIIGVMCDESWLQIYDNEFRFDEFYNARVMAWNLYLHAWNTFAICPFANAVMFTTKAPVPATDIKSPATETIAVGAEKTVTVTTTPTNTTSSIEFESENDSIFIIESVTAKTANIKGVSTGTTKLIIKTDNGLETFTEITVTA